jgi:Protein of unknown function (DUF1266)
MRTLRSQVLYQFLEGQQTFRVLSVKHREGCRIMKPTLQNHPGDKDFPVSFQSIFFKLTPTRFKALPLISKQLLVLIPLLVAGIAVQREGIEALFLLIGLPSVFIIFLFWAKYNQITEQKKYYKLTQIPALTEAQRLASQLVLPINYFDGGWSETLKLWPTEVRFKGKTPKFSTFTLHTKMDELADLEKWWGVLSQKSYERTFTNLFDGLHSAQFAYDARYTDSFTFQVHKERLSELTLHGTDYIDDCSKSIEGCAPKLLWGFDLWRASQLAGSAFSAGIISEEQAWTDRLKATDCAHALFDSLESFMQNYLLGVAYWSDSLEVTHDRMRKIQDYQTNCDWPVAKLVWPKKSETDLPEVILTGCYAAVNARRKSEQGPSTDFLIS